MFHKTISAENSQGARPVHFLLEHLEALMDLDTDIC